MTAVALAPMPRQITDHVRLTARGRVVVTGGFAALISAGLIFFSAGSAATGERGAEAPARTVIVDEGDTLWQIASDVAPPGETREFIYRIQELNALTGPELDVGQILAVPLS